MYFFFHLFVGIILGFLLADLLHDGRWLIPCAIGAVLPDLIDKPVGYLLLQFYFGYGRILFHTLLVFAIILAAGIVLWRYRGSPLLLALAAGILLHQVLDAMWNEAEGWLFPLLGTPLLWHIYPRRNLFILLRDNLLNPTEWLMAGLILTGLVLWVQRERVRAMAQEHGRSLGIALSIGGILLWMVSGIVLSYGLVRKLLSPFGRFWYSQLLILSFVSALLGLLLWRWGARLRSHQGGPPTGEAPPGTMS
jgi:hypothetical protein